jgi:hypothetical protein
MAMLAAMLARLVLPEWGPARPTAVGDMTAKDEFVFVHLWRG